MYLRWIALFLFFWIAHSSNVFSVELDNKGDSVWEIESLEPGNFDYNINKACFPLEYLYNNKFWPSHSRIDDVYGDKNLTLKLVR